MADAKRMLKDSGCPDHVVAKAEQLGFDLATLGSIWDIIKADGCAAAPFLRLLLATMPAPWGTIVGLVLDVLCPVTPTLPTGAKP